MRRLLLLFCFAVRVQRVRTEIASSADLNCDFASSCRWRNGTNGQEDSADFAAAQNLQMDDFHRITAIRPDQDDYFVYSYALAGRQESMLVSDVVNCQLGGANLKYWYWKTGKDVALDVCIRQPPGNRDRAALKCYDGLSATFAQQWQFRAIELPPVSQPFELIFRALFTAPLDIIALDNIQYNAILCEGESRVISTRSRRSTSSLQVMGLNEWRALSLTQGIQVEAGHAPVMLIVGDNVPEAAETSTSTTTPAPFTFPTFPTLPPLTFPTLTTETVTLPPETTTETPTTTTTICPPESTTVEAKETSSTEVAASIDATPSVNHMDNAVKFIKNIQPVLPYIPALVRSIQAIDPRVAAATGTDPLAELNELSKIVGIDLVETASEIRRAAAHSAPVVKEEERVVALVTDLSSRMDHRYDGMLRDRNPIRTDPPAAPAPKANIFGLERASRAPTFTSPTVYPPKLVKSLKTNVQRQPSESGLGVAVEETMDLSHLSTEEIKQLEQFHRKIFHRRGESTPPPTSLPDDLPTYAPPLVVFKKNRPETQSPGPPAIAPPVYHPPREELPEVTLGGANSMSDLLMEHMGDLKGILPPDALDDLSKLREIPDLDELTKGMDVSLINKPGGFATLKKQFMQRMIRRSLGLPPTDDIPPRFGKKKALPPPIVPIKISRKAMMKAMRAMNRRA
ncbi:mam-5 [Pristionchus pacificus]|uniref:MAM domain-containing protein n=1 Tax=Pristionchus pacificus TaxID=54126 RepID=A0A2A6D341_PRIPA|nr:mam-5 [Pristionchus pacificus]|eukprot:PDM84756.1 hypothetical protein PRIPAC_33779 [Pristionchus pacificus]